MSDKKTDLSWGAVLGRLLCNVIVSCIFVCLASIFIVATLKFIMWLI